MKGLIHIYCGDGKGKTSAAVGLAVRAAGSNMKILMARFLKNDHSGEVSILKQIPGITVLPCDREFGFSFRMSQKEKEEAAVYYSSKLREAIRLAETGTYDMLVLDEIMSVYENRFVEREVLTTFLKEKPEALEIVMTGRNPDDSLLSAADYISEIKKIRHPFDQGVPARKGIEL